MKNRLKIITILLVAIAILYAYPQMKNENEYLAYIPNAGDGTISIIDVSINKLIDEIKIGNSVSHGIAVSSDGSKIYTGNIEDGKVFIIDVNSKEILKTIDTGRNLHGIDITPDGKYLFTASGDLQEGEEFDYINIIDTKEDKIIKSIRSNGKSPSHIDFTKDSKLAFVNNVMSGNVSVVDIEKFEIISTIDVGLIPNESELSPDDKYLYVANVQDGTISVVDVKEGKEIDKIKVGEGTHGVAVSNDGKYVWTTNMYSKDVSVIDIENSKVIKTIETGGQANHISVLPNSDLVYVSNLESEDISAIDMKKYEVINTIKIGKKPHEIEFVRLK
ncbi:beta-propeller fold lactonase family protein [Tissierella carlieri]|uniref:Beta-propeller fold lactonase family protein n=1 Tax=Tissierella carlieri TaxID=689904 RepID=A0ABT1SEK0_9FIRM|nr:amine dehydrogenase large subunit [Tissierella carlieri]MBU5313492.1 beta-propeller fold lactonase family protein [Tissierella carlieri]MCQ4924720.1 beta-propeller fold lactonase family protein [Tissierella carlieri]